MVVRFDRQRLPEVMLALLSNVETPLVLSSASVWELSIKHHQGMLLEFQHAITDLPALLRAGGLQNRLIAISHALHVVRRVLIPSSIATPRLPARCSSRV